MVVMLLFCMAKVSCADREAKIHDHVTGSEVVKGAARRLLPFVGMIYMKKYSPPTQPSLPVPTSGSPQVEKKKIFTTPVNPCTVQPGVGHRDHALCSSCSPRPPPLQSLQPKDNRVESAANQASEASAQQIAKQGLGRFMSLLNSFDNT
ncbi:uncharacterized protein DS421_14g473920 [Arachis hypogaea]|nr:uncharacterized protein DS421_14g473920 [Arachis hypogaea]